MPAPGNGDGLFTRGLANLLQSTHEARIPEAFGEEGLRDRKKRVMRQRISDTATMMFLERGFDDVRVSEIAEACEVSEKTIFNYFPTKESLLFDRTDAVADEIREALRDRADNKSLIEAVLDILARQLDEFHHFWTEADDKVAPFSMMRRFGELVDSTPSLRAAQQDMMEQLIDVAATTLGERARVDPDDPEPQIAAVVIVGLWRVLFRSMMRHADGKHTADQARDAIMTDLTRAARLADTGLWSFNEAVQGPSGKQQLKEAVVSVNDARKQVVTAIKQARDAFRIVVAEGHAAHHEQERRERADPRHGARVNQTEARMQQLELKAQSLLKHAERMKQQAEQLRRQSER